MSQNMNTNKIQNTNTIALTKINFKPQLSIMDNVRGEDLIACINNTLKPNIDGYEGSNCVIKKSGIKFLAFINLNSSLIEKPNSVINNLPGAHLNVKLTEKLKEILSVYTDKNNIKYEIFKGNQNKNALVVTLSADKVLKNILPEPENNYSYMIDVTKETFTKGKHKFKGMLRIKLCLNSLIEEAKYNKKEED